jgi:hypothetical protein
MIESFDTVLYYDTQSVKETRSVPVSHSIATHLLSVWFPVSWTHSEYRDNVSLDSSDSPASYRRHRKKKRSCVGLYTYARCLLRCPSTRQMSGGRNFMLTAHIVAFTFVNVLSIIPSLRLSTCLECKKPSCRGDDPQDLKHHRRLTSPFLFRGPAAASRGSHRVTLYMRQNPKRVVCAYLVRHFAGKGGTFPTRHVRCLPPSLSSLSSGTCAASGKSYHGCGEYFKSGAVVYSAIYSQ